MWTDGFAKCKAVPLFTTISTLPPTLNGSGSQLHASIWKAKVRIFPQKATLWLFAPPWGLSDTRGTHSNGAWHIFIDDHDTMASMVQTA